MRKGHTKGNLNQSPNSPRPETPPPSQTKSEQSIENEYMLQFFHYEHLPEHLQTISKPFGDLARYICDTVPRNPERTVALRKLLEAKDCAVRAQLFK